MTLPISLTTKNSPLLPAKTAATPLKPKTEYGKILRIRQFADYKFLRQKPVGDYIVDFYCACLQLVIEIDGDSHAETAEFDAERTRILSSLGLRVIRFSNGDVLRNIEGVYEELSKTINSILLHDNLVAEIRERSILKSGSSTKTKYLI